MKKGTRARAVPSFLSFLPLPSSPSNMSIVDIPFLAAMLLKLNAGEKLSSSDISALTAAIMDPVPEAPLAPAPAPVIVVEPVVAPVVEPTVPVHHAPKIKKIKTEPAKVAAEPPVQKEEPPEPLQISPKHCMARMVQQKKVIPGTEDNRVYEAKQCIRLRAKGELLCPKCEDFYKAYREKSKGKNNWEGFLNETPLDHLRVVGSKWFRENYPHGLPTNTTTANTTTEITTANITETTTANTHPTTETVLVPNATIKEVKWANWKKDGIHYIYNIRDRRIYKADVSKEGEDQIMWDSFEGKFIHGEINFYEEENEDVPEDF